MTAWRPAILGHIRNDREYRDGRPEHWTSQALCAEIGDYALFFPEMGQSARRAKAICAQCPVRELCLEDALALPGAQDYGVRGGTSERERRDIRRARNQTEREAS